jgi:UDP-N-acetylglucosamine acyltransferase
MRVMDGPGGRVRVGNGTILREHVTVHRAVGADAWTSVGDRCYLLATAHVGHDCVVGHDVTIANGALLAGFVSVGDRAFISGNVAVHQFVRVGRLAIVGGLARVPKDVPPFTMIAHDGWVCGLNVVGMRRAGMSQEERLIIKRAYHTIYHAKLNVSQAIQVLLAQPSTPLVDEITAFIRGSKRGICSARRRNHRGHGDTDHWGDHVARE